MLYELEEVTFGFIQDANSDLLTENSLLVKETSHIVLAQTLSLLYYVTSFPPLLPS